MINSDLSSNCVVCGELIKGRSDKKYCSETCKSIFHYEKKQAQEKHFLAFQKQLRTNRKVLKKFNHTGMTSLRRAVLHAQGFNPAYYTHTWQNKRGQTYYFTYDFGIFPFLDRKNKEVKEKYLIIIWQDYMKAMPPF